MGPWPQRPLYYSQDKTESVKRYRLCEQDSHRVARRFSCSESSPSAKALYMQSSPFKRTLPRCLRVSSSCLLRHNSFQFALGPLKRWRNAEKVTHSPIIHVIRKQLHSETRHKGVNAHLVVSAAQNRQDSENIISDAEKGATDVTQAQICMEIPNKVIRLVLLRRSKSGV